MSVNDQQIKDGVHTGTLRKLQGALDGHRQVQYGLPISNTVLPLNTLLGEIISIESLKKIQCVYCGRLTKKSFNQGYCYPCFKKLAQCDQCIVKPELCHYHKGTCREPEWGKKICMTDHIVYLANSSGAKVGITRAPQIPTRWIDQGAIEALPVFRVTTRLMSGLVEDLLRSEVSDRTNWRTMLKGQIESLNLAEIRDRLLDSFQKDIEQLQADHGVNALQPIYDVQQIKIRYPVQIYPDKVTALNLDSTPHIQGQLLGIKGQYLILDTGVLNIRKFTGYHVSVTIH